MPDGSPLDDDPAFALHRGGKIGTAARVGVTDASSLALAYTPGVGRVSQAIADDREHVWRYTGRPNSVAVLTNGTAVLGLGDIGPEAALPVMEGKALLFHRFAGIDAVPICAHARSVDELVALGTASMPAKRWNSSALPSMTGNAASGPMSPSPSTAVPFVSTATLLDRPV